MAANLKLLSATQAADLLGVSKGTIYNWVYERKIPNVKIGTVVRFRQVDIERFINEHLREATNHV